MDFFTLILSNKLMKKKKVSFEFQIVAINDQVTKLTDIHMLQLLGVGSYILYHL